VASVIKTASPEQKRQLLQVARNTAEEVLKVPSQGPRSAPRIEGEFGGAFVTFWAGRQLRGCVGSFAHTSDIVSMIQEFILVSYRYIKLYSLIFKDFIDNR